MFLKTDRPAQLMAQEFFDLKYDVRVICLEGELDSDSNETSRKVTFVPT